MANGMVPAAVPTRRHADASHGAMPAPAQPLAARGKCPTTGFDVSAGIAIAVPVRLKRCPSSLPNTLPVAGLIR
jgi:hypothetical protein